MIFILIKTWKIIIKTKLTKSIETPKDTHLKIATKPRTMKQL